MDASHGDFREHVEAAKRLQKLRYSIAQSEKAGMPITPPFDDPSTTSRPSRPFALAQPATGIPPPQRPRPSLQSSHDATSPLRDPMIYPGLYAPSGMDMLGILIRVMQRPNPTYNLGFIDSSCALAVCIASFPDFPIIYCSDAFYHLTHYTQEEVLGRNCRFLQKPHDTAATQSIASEHTAGANDARCSARSDRGTDEIDKTKAMDPAVTTHQIAILKEMREKLRRGEETQDCVMNYKKNGERFENLLTTVPIQWGDGRRFVVGFQAERRVR